MPSKLSDADFSAQVNLAGFEEQEALLRQMPAELTAELLKSVRKGNLDMKKNVQSRIQSFTGRTVRSIGSKVKANGPGSVTGITGPSDKGKYARAHILRFLQDGSYWQNEDRTQPWVHDLTDWVKAKFSPPEKDVLRTAYALAKSIKQKGVKGKPIVRPVMESRLGYVLLLISDTLDKIVEKMRVK